MTKRNRYRSPEVDDLIERIQLLPNSSQRDSLIDRTNRVIFNEAPWVFLWHGQTNIVTQLKIAGYVPKLIFNSERYIDIIRE
jgi:ABC-type transport system substrate-binding protein